MPKRTHVYICKICKAVIPPNTTISNTKYPNGRDLQNHLEEHLYSFIEYGLVKRVFEESYMNA